MGDVGVDVDVEMWHQIDLVQQHHVDRAEHHRVLQRLVLALGHRVDHRLGVLAHVELRRTHEVPDVLDDHQIEGRKVQALQRPVDHRGIEVAFAAEAVVGVQQRDLRTPATEPRGVDVGGDVTFDHPDRDVAGQFVEGCSQHRGLTGPR